LTKVNSKKQPFSIIKKAACKRRLFLTPTKKVMAQELDAESKLAIQSAVKAKPTVLYTRIMAMYPQEAPKFTKGFETTDSSKSTMITFLIRKAENSPNPRQFILSL